MNAAMTPTQFLHITLHFLDIKLIIQDEESLFDSLFFLEKITFLFFLFFEISFFFWGGGGTGPSCKVRGMGLVDKGKHGP